MQGNDDDEDVKAAFAAVYGSKASGKACGGGFLVADDVIITCAHVVNTALGRTQHAGEYPGSPSAPPSLVVTFPYLDNRRLSATLIGWVPRRAPTADSPLRAGGQTWAGDLALLRIDEEAAAGAQPVRVERHRLGSTVFSWYGSGESTTVVSAVVQAESGPWIVLDTMTSAKDFVPGYSGGPVWDRARRAVVGLVVAAEGRRGYAIPMREIMRHLAGRQPLLCDPELGSAQQLAMEPFREAVTEVLNGEGVSAETVEKLARRMNVPAGAPRTQDIDTDDLIAAALRIRRGVATLAAGVCKMTADLDTRRQVTATSLRVRPGELLSTVEFGGLARMLAETPTAAFNSAMRRALPDLHSHPSENDGVLGMVEFLERLVTRPGTVPSLVRVLEFLAVKFGDPDLRDGLRAWCSQVAKRIGVAEGALAERRAEAEAWAVGAETRARIQIRLERVDAETFRHVAWIQYGSTHRTVCTDDRPRPDTEVLACIERILRADVPDDVETVLLEFFVDIGDLDLAVDRWIIPGAVNRMLGVEYEVVVRCLNPRLVNRQQWRKRWRMLGVADPLVLGADLASPDGVYAALTAAETDVACVIAFPAEGSRLPVIAGCIYAGVPAVLWSRVQPSEADRSRITGITTRNEQPVIPAAVRKLRVRAAADADHPDGHLGLLWDDPDQYPRELTLSVP